MGNDKGLSLAGATLLTLGQIPPRQDHRSIIMLSKLPPEKPCMLYSNCVCSA